MLRLNLIGIHPDGSRGKNFFEWLLDGIRADKDMTMFADACINPLSNWTIAALIAKILARDRSGKILHIGSRDVKSKAAIGELTRALPRLSRRHAAGQRRRHRRRRIPAQTDVAQYRQGGRAPWPDADRGAGADTIFARSRLPAALG